MYFYLIIYAALAFAALIHNKRSPIYLSLMALFLVWFMGFRFETGCDYFGYLHRWNTFAITSLTQTIQQDEFGLILLMAAAKVGGLNFIWFNVIVSVILVACYLRFAIRHISVNFIFALLFPVVILQLGMSGTRQAIACAFLLLSLNAFVNKSTFYTGFWILVGMLFHASVIIFLPIVFLVNRNIDTLRIGSALVIIGPLAGLLISSRVDVYESRYLDSAMISGGAIFRYLLVFSSVPFFFVFRKKIQSMYPDVFPLLKLGALLIVSLAPLIIVSSVALHRLNYYVVPFSILIWTYLIPTVFNRQQIGRALPLSAYGAYIFLWFLFSSHAEICYIPYQNTWFL